MNWLLRRSSAEYTAIVIVASAIVFALLSQFLPWIAQWPAEWTLPATSWIGSTIGGMLETLKPFARAVSALLGLPMNGANNFLTKAPWPLIMGIIAGLAWWIGGLRMAVIAMISMLFVLLSGYWRESMATLALVTVSVPLALMIGLAIGILAHETAWARKLIETILDVMQTVPTFAYLTPLLILFGFGPVVGLIASAIYAAPPMARNVMLGLERIEPEIREAAAMAGTSRLQRLFWVELPAASTQILVGVNQCVMAALSMVIIAAVIGGFNDIGWEVLLTMRKAQFGQSLLAGMVIVVFAILIDRMSAGLTEPEKRGDGKTAWLIAGIGMVLGLLSWAANVLFDPGLLGVMRPAAEAIDEALSAFTTANGANLDAIKNAAMFYVLLPLRIGLNDAVLPFTWGFVWTPSMSAVFLGASAIIGALLIWRGRLGLGVCALCTAGICLFGITQVPWPAFIIGIGAIAWRAGGYKLAAFATLSLLLILLAGLWDRAMLSIYLCGAAVAVCALFGGLLGLLAAVSPLAWRILQPICDTLQTIPLFVFLIPMLMFFPDR